MDKNQPVDRISDIRRFNRFYTQKIGLLNRGILKTRYPLTQARIIFDLAQQEFTTATELINNLGIDPGYLSRILKKFEHERLIKKARSESDSRLWLLSLTQKGRDEFNILNERSNLDIKALLENRSGEDQQKLVSAMKTIEKILGEKSESQSPIYLRHHRPGDIGWITHRHGVLYAEEYGWDETFEALVADILAKFIQKHDPVRERIWIAEQDGEPIGSIMIVDGGDNVAKLRLLLVEPKAREKGLGKRLIDECIIFAGQKGYKKITLWTNSVLLEARHLYSKAGFKIIEEKSHHSFGHDLVAETWEMLL